MERDHSVLDRCKECGQVVRMLVFERGLDDEGNEYRALYAQSVPHGREACETMKALEKETWPLLW